MTNDELARFVFPKKVVDEVKKQTRENEEKTAKEEKD